FDHLAQQFNLTSDQIADRVGLNRSTVSNLLRLLELHEYVQQLVRDELLSMGQARAMAGISDHARQQQLAKRAVRERLSVREVETAARKLAKQGGEASDNDGQNSEQADGGSSRAAAGGGAAV